MRREPWSGEGRLLMRLFGKFRPFGRARRQEASSVPTLPDGADNGSAREKVSAARADREIRRYLATSGLEDQVIVEEDGSIVALAEADRRLLQGLVSVVESRLGTGDAGSRKIRYVSPIEFRQLDDARISRLKEKKSGSRQAEEARAGNNTVNWILDRAIESRASDIHLDIRRNDARLSFRIYGQVTEVTEGGRMTRDMAVSVAMALFNLAGDKWQELSPCDCSLNHEHGGRLYRIRCNSLPDTRGQTLSCRVRDPSFVLPLEESGYSEHQVGLIQRICRAPGGLILITGETNSGKSTTLAGLMLNAPRGERMIEIADPVEVEFDHVTHCEINRHGENARAEFRAVRAATVRQNPDALVLGEIRDDDTAEAAEEMAIQGKRVYSTLHTQSCTAAIPRLINLGVDLHLLTLPEFLAGIVNQNLVPLVCPHCGLHSHPDSRIDRRYRRIFGEDAVLRYINPEGCGKCVSGVTGQTLVAEVYPLCLDGGKAHSIIARQELWKLEGHMKEAFGIQSKQDHARDKVLQGLIDPDRTEAIIGEFSQASGSGVSRSGVSRASGSDVSDSGEVSRASESGVSHPGGGSKNPDSGPSVVSMEEVR